MIDPNELSLADLTAEIEKMAKRANQRLVELSRHAGYLMPLYPNKPEEGDYWISPPTDNIYIRRELKLAGTPDRTKFSRTKPKTIPEARKRYAALERFLSGATTVNRIKDIEKRRRRTFRQNHPEFKGVRIDYVKMYDILNMVKDDGYDSQQALDIYKWWSTFDHGKHFDSPIEAYQQVKDSGMPALTYQQYLNMNMEGLKDEVL